MSKDVKITLHEEWDWWLASHSEDRAMELTGRFDRGAVRWKPPAPNAAGWVYAVNVWVPHGELSNVYGEDVSGNIAWLHPAARGHRVGGHIVIANPNDVHAGTDGEFVDGWTLADGRLLLVFRSHSPFPPETRSRIERKRAEHCAGETGDAGTSRCLVGEYEDARPLHLWDLALPARPSQS